VDIDYRHGFSLTFLFGRSSLLFALTRLQSQAWDLIMQPMGGRPFATSNILEVMPPFKHFFAIFMLPGVVTLAIPLAILQGAHPLRRAEIVLISTLLDFLRLLLGLSLILFGLFLMVKTISLFATIGQGTLAPWAPPQKLVLKGIYCHVRNPMISGVLAILLGEAAMAGSLPLFLWFLGFGLANLIYIPFIEEPALEGRFGQDYRLYRANVPRWLPRLKAWDGEPE
jgi:protein-S-isoprenylcysteine O-methyltransferase Ste14